MSSIWVKFANWRNGNHGAAYRTRLFVYDEYVPASDLAAARAENERLTKERDAQYDENVNRIAMQAKAEAERDEARASLRHMEGFDRCTCGPCAIHGTASLADAERDMRQRAADACAGIEVDRWDKWKDGADMLDQGASDGAEECLKAILALPLKHADREGKV